MNPKRILLKIGLVLLTAFLIVSFKPEDNKPKFKTFTDTRDNQEYLTVKIGNQWWFAENLNFETDKDSYCRECETYGRLYRYEAAFNACPEGWHVPTVQEWNSLINFLGGPEIAGGKMKSENGWRFPDINDNNTFGFSAIPAPTRGTRG